MYLEKINIENYGSIEKLKYKMPFNEHGNPKPLVIIGKNGTGKTLLISNIVHTLIEIKRNIFNELPETDNKNYYRLGSKEYIRNGKEYSYINYSFSNNLKFVDMAINNYEKIKNKTFDNVNMNDTGLKNNGFYHKLDIKDKEKMKQVFDENVFMYLPVDRYYSPSWLNNSNPKLKFNSNYESYVGKNNNNIIKNNLLEDIEAWILDVIIDKLLYEEKRITGEDGKEIKIYSGKNTNIQNAINKVISHILKINDSDVKYARIAISKKNNRRISIQYWTGTEELEYVPKFSNLSSGEIMIIGLIVAILKDFDRSDKENIEDLSGIVIIDEIDAHLHLDFCRLVLPEIIKMFPKVQFIITSHSPFFLLGMKEIFLDDCEFLNMPNGLINDLDNFEEIKKMYDLVESDYSKKIETIKEYENILKNISKPLIITEGKTDWKHLKNALRELQANNKFKDLDVDFLEYEETMGDKELEILLKKAALINNNHKIIGIFDNDEETGKKYDKDTWKNFENNVYGWCIPNPRNLPYGISIEFLYEDEDIKKEDENGKRLYLTDEFKEKSLQNKNNPLIVSNQRNFISKFYKTGQVKILEANEVFNENEENMALSKNEFADNIYNKIPPFENIKVDNFEEVFNRIQRILDA